MVLWELYEKFDGQRDARVYSWAASSPGALVVTVAGYLLTVCWLGPRFMANRKPYRIQPLLVFYNALQIIFNTWLCIVSYGKTYGKDYSFTCQPLDFSKSPESMEIVSCVYWYYLAKLIDLADTVFFVLRKKNKHITFLHLYHHTFMVIYVWLGLNFAPGGHGVFLGIVNTFIHTVMYTYYLLSALGPQLKPYLWWKKYLTTLQMGQFVLVFLHAAQLLWNDCDYPRSFLGLIIFNTLFFFALFYNFFNKAYKKEE